MMTDEEIKLVNHARNIRDILKRHHEDDGEEYRMSCEDKLISIIDRQAQVITAKDAEISRMRSDLLYIATFETVPIGASDINVQELGMDAREALGMSAQEALEVFARENPPLEEDDE